MFGLHFSRLGSVSRLGLVPKALAILRSYGADAHVYLPGIGTVNGLTAGNYLDSAGTTAATVDNPVGLSLDALQAMTLGSELNATLDFTGWFTQAGWSVSSGVASYSGAGATNALKDFTLKANTHYLIEIDATVASGGYKLMCGFDTVSGTISTSGRYAARLIRGSNTYLYVAAVGASELSFPRISVREIPGVHATQATTANKALLKSAAGKYSWQFDGSNDSLLTGNLGITNTVSVVIAGVVNSLAATSYFIAEAANGIAMYVFTDGSVYVEKAGVGTVRNTPAGVIVAGVPFVLTFRLSGGTALFRKNGVQVSTGASALVFSATTGMRIGTDFNGTSNPLNGSLNSVDVITATTTDSELLTLERLAGQLAGVSI